MPVSWCRSALQRSVAVLFVAIAVLAVAEVGFAGTGWMEDQSRSRSILLKTRVDLTPDVVNEIAGHGVHITYAWPEIRAMAVTAAQSKVSDLLADPLIELVEYDQQASVNDAGTPPDDGSSPPSVLVPYASATTPVQTWNQDMADTPGSGWSGAGVTVAVIDAGLPQNWEEFLPPNSVDLTYAVGFGAEGWGDYHSEVNAIRGVGGHVGLFPHGLAVSSVIVGFPSEFGLVGGAAPGAKILPIRTLNQFNTGWSSWWAAAFVYVGNLKASGAIPGPLVVNFSIQMHSDSQILKSAIDYAIAQGVVVVTIAGNYNPNAPVSFPGRLPECITAAACGWRSQWAVADPWFLGDVPEADASQVYIAPFSGREPLSVPPASQIDVTAPGSWVFGEWLDGPGFSEGRRMDFDGASNFIFGTSFAAPHVAGIVAQMLQKNPTLTQSQAEAILRSTALPIPPDPAPFIPFGFALPWDERAVGAGLVQGTSAVSTTPDAPMGTTALAGRTGGNSTEGPHLSLRLASGVGRVPVEFAIRGAVGSAYTASVYDLSGRLVRRWSATAPGVTWNGNRTNGIAAPSGVYFLRVEADGRAANAKVVVTR